MAETIETLLGVPLEGPAVAAFLLNAGHSGPVPKPKFNYLFLEDLGVSLQTVSRVDPLIVKGVTISLSAYKGPIPYRLDRTSNRTAVEGALGSPDFISHHHGSDGVGMQFFSEKIVIWINVVDGVARDVAVWNPDDYEKAISRRLSAPSTYGSPPKVGSADAVRALRDAPFLRDWRTRDTLLKFRDPYLRGIEEGLDAFFKDVIDSSEAEDMAALVTATRVFVELVNAVNTETEQALGEPMIETLERDELASFISDVFKATGAKIEESDDVTLPWREW